MKVICVSDKQGNLIMSITAYDNKVAKVLFNKLKKNKKMNVYIRGDEDV